MDMGIIIIEKFIWKECGGAGSCQLRLCPIDADPLNLIWLVPA